MRAERRKHSRLRSLKSGQIVFHRHWPVIDCVIRNFTKAGACLEMAGQYNTPLAFQLLLTQDKIQRPCRQIWRQQERIGVEFSSEAI